MSRVYLTIGLFFILSIQAFAKIPEKIDVLIIGAGLSGLSTAYELKKAGISYHILELTPYIGGRVRTVKYEKEGETLLADSGMEEYWASNPALKMIRELKLVTRHDVAMSSIVLNGKKHEFTEDTQPQYMAKIFNPKEIKALNGFKAKAEVITNEIKSKNISKTTMKLKDISLEAWVKKQGLPKKVSEWIRVSVECEAGTEWGAISALDGIDEFHIFLGEGEYSYRIINGNEIFTDALTKFVDSDNITTNQRVTKILNVGDEVTVSYLDVATNESKTIKASHVVSTIPIYRLNMEIQIEPSLSAKKIEGISSQTYGSYFKVHVFVPSSASRYWTKDGESFLPYLSDSPLGVIYEGNPDQDTKMKIISLLVTGHMAEGFNFMNQDQAKGMLTGAFEKFWPGFAREIKGMDFYRFHPRAIGSWPVGRSRFDDLSNEIRRPENRLYLAGDFTENSHSSGAVQSALRVVEQIKEAKTKEKKK